MRHPVLLPVMLVVLMGEFGVRLQLLKGMRRLAAGLGAALRGQQDAVDIVKAAVGAWMAMDGNVAAHFSGAT
jgi:hypothetical protein